MKNVIMPFFYGSQACLKAIEGREQQFEAVMKQNCSGAYRLREFLMKNHNVGVDSFSWRLPDNHNVFFKVTEKVKEEMYYDDFIVTLVRNEQRTTKKGSYIKLPANIVHSVDAYILRELTCRAKLPQDIAQNVVDAKYNLGEATAELQDYIDIYNETNMVSVRALQYINTDMDVNNMPEGMYSKALEIANWVLNRSSEFPVIVIHDSFQVPYRFGNQVRELYRNLIAEICDSTLLDYIVSQTCVGKFLYRKNTNASALVLESDYGLH